MNTNEKMRLALREYLIREMPAGTVIGDPEWWVPKILKAIAEPAEPAAQEPVASVLAEVAKAAAKFPTWPTDPLHAIAVLGEEFGELTKAVLQHTYEPHKSTADDVRTEAIQTAAMALRFLMSLERYQYQHCEQHEQGNHYGSN